MRPLLLLAACEVQDPVHSPRPDDRGAFADIPTERTVVSRGGRTGGGTLVLFGGDVVAACQGADGTRADVSRAPDGGTPCDPAA